MSAVAAMVLFPFLRLFSFGLLRLRRQRPTRAHFRNRHLSRNQDLALHRFASRTAPRSKFSAQRTHRPWLAAAYRGSNRFIRSPYGLPFSVRRLHQAQTRKIVSCCTLISLLSSMVSSSLCVISFFSYVWLAAAFFVSCASVLSAEFVTSTAQNSQSLQSSLNSSQHSVHSGSSLPLR